MCSWHTFPDVPSSSLLCGCLHCWYFKFVNYFRKSEQQLHAFSFDACSVFMPIWLAVARFSNICLGLTHTHAQKVCHSLVTAHMVPVTLLLWMYLRLTLLDTVSQISCMGLCTTKGLTRLLVSSNYSGLFVTNFLHLPVISTWEWDSGSQCATTADARKSLEGWTFWLPGLKCNPSWNIWLGSNPCWNIRVGTMHWMH